MQSSPQREWYQNCWSWIILKPSTSSLCLYIKRENNNTLSKLSLWAQKYGPVEQWDNLSLTFLDRAGLFDQDRGSPGFLAHSSEHDSNFRQRQVGVLPQGTICYNDPGNYFKDLKFCISLCVRSQADKFFFDPWQIYFWEAYSFNLNLR